MPDPITDTPSGLAEAGPDGLEAALARALRRVNIARVTAASGRAGSLDVDRIDLGDAAIDRVVIEGLATGIHTGAALLRRVRIILELHFTVDWRYDLGLFGSDSGTKVLGSKAKTIELHDIRIPMLQDIDLVVPEAAVDDVGAELLPVVNVALGAGGFENLVIEDTRLPPDGFAVDGLEFGDVEIDQVGVPAADTRHLAIAAFAPEAPLRLPEVNVRGIEVPAVQIPDAGSASPRSSRTSPAPATRRGCSPTRTTRASSRAPSGCATAWAGCSAIGGRIDPSA